VYIRVFVHMENRSGILYVISACFAVCFVAEFTTAVLTSRDFSGMKI